MKQAENNEIDILLRDLAQRERPAANAQGVSHSAKSDRPAETSIHLDADELNAYAEKVLPVATRARYTAHLVDCDDCRKIVSQLSVAAGLPVEDRIASPETVSSTWREKLAALLSPRRLRYAMPALVLFAVIAVGFFALRQKKEASLVAQNERAETSRVATTQVESKPSATSPAPNGSKAAGNEEQAGSQKHSQATPATNSGTTDKAAASPGAAASPAAAPAKDKESSKSETVATARPSYAPEPPPPSAKPTTETARAENAAKAADESREKEEAAARKKEADKTSAFGVAAAKDAPASPQTGSAQAPARKAKTAPANGRLMGGIASQRTDDQAEIRTIAGRRFRRQNGAWVDTAYESSQSTTNVARGSEQYRALIADEPAIGTIAEQLSGQVIVVWKGRAYRIH
jgi:hypothetical protein